MSFAYDDGVVWLDDLVASPTPGAEYALCEAHADKMTPPVGWKLVDRRRELRPLFASLEVA